jgi:nucleoside-diphosphate-sugar epimerase
VDGVVTLMRSDVREPANIGNREYVTVEQLVDTVMEVAGKSLHVEWVEGPVGVQSRNFSNDRVERLGWAPRHSLRDGLCLTYPWIEETVRSRAASTV